MAFAFVLTGKRRIDRQQADEQMRGERWRLTYTYTCLSGDTTGAKNLADDVGGVLTTTYFNFSINADDVASIALATTILTITKAGGAGTAGTLVAEVLSR